MKTKARKDSIRKRNNFEEKYSRDPMSNAESERRSHRIRALIATGIVLVFFTTYLSELYDFKNQGLQILDNESETMPDNWSWEESADGYTLLQNQNFYVVKIKLLKLYIER